MMINWLGFSAKAPRSLRAVYLIQLTLSSPRPEAGELWFLSFPLPRPHLCNQSFVNKPSSDYAWHLTPVLSPGKCHGWRSLVGCSPWGREELDSTERLHFHFSLSRIGEGNGNPLQCSCLEDPRDGEPGGLPSRGSHRVGHDWNDLAAAAADYANVCQLSISCWNSSWCKVQ